MDQPWDLWQSEEGEPTNPLDPDALERAAGRLRAAVRVTGEPGELRGVIVTGPRGQTPSAELRGVVEETVVRIEARQGSDGGIHRELVVRQHVLWAAGEPTVSGMWAVYPGDDGTIALFGEAKFGDPRASRSFEEPPFAETLTILPRPQDDAPPPPLPDFDLQETLETIFEEAEDDDLLNRTQSLKYAIEH